MKKLLMFVIFTAIILVSTGGFYDAKEIAHTVSVIAMGIDKGENMPYRISFQIERTGNGESGATAEVEDNEEEGMKKSKDVITVEAPTILSAFSRANSINSVDLSLNNVKMVIMSSEIAKDGAENFISELASATEFKNNAYLAVSVKKAEDVLKNVSPEDEEYISVYYEQIVLRHYLAANRYFLLSETYFTLLKDEGDFVLPLVAQRENDEFENFFKDDTNSKLVAGMIPKESKHKVEFLGGAVFSGGRLKGYLTESEMLALSFAGGFFAPKDITVEYPENSENFVVVKLSQEQNSKIKSSVGENPMYTIKVSLFGSYEYIPSGNYMQFDEEFKDYLEKEIEKSITQTLEKCLWEYNSDVLALKNHGKIHFIKNSDMEKYNLNKMLKSSHIIPRVTVETKRNGRFTFE